MNNVLLSFFLSTHNLLLMGVFFLIIYFFFNTSDFTENIKKRISIMCVIWWLFLVFAFPPTGFDYQIYTYNAQLTINDLPAYGRSFKITDSIYGESFSNPKYLDYTGMQHLIYVGLSLIDLYHINMILNGLGFKIYLVFLLVLTILLIQKGDFFYSSKNIQTQKIWAILIITFHPVFAFNFIIQWEDKLQLLIIPLLMFILIDKKKFYLASFFLGFSIAFNGILIFFLIPYLFYLYNSRKKTLIINLLIVLLSITFTLVPFFPDSIIGWVNRANRLNEVELFWYSIYLLLPEKLYSPQLNQFTILLIMLIFYAMFLAKKIILRDLIIVSVCLTLVFGPYNSIERILPVILLIAILNPAVVRLYWITLSLLLFIYSFLSVNFEFSKNIHFTHVLLFYLPFFWVIGMYIHSRLLNESNNLEKTAC